MDQVPGPFPLAVSDRALGGDALRAAVALFERPQDWVRHQQHFYRCFIAEVDGQLGANLLERVRGRVAQALELPLGPTVRVTAQRMEEGDSSDRHSDRPLAGYEAARLIVQLDSGVGGHFRAFDGDDVWVERPPRRNGAVALGLGTRSDHDVTPCTGTRRTVVFHFWHRVNPPDARAALDQVLGRWSVAELPSGLDARMTSAEARLPDVLTHRAAAVAVLMHRWGRPEAEVSAAYGAVLDGRPLDRLTALAEALVHLHVEGFDATIWDDLATQWRGHRPPEVVGRWVPELP